ncbi:TPP-dependent acetoin dehydrogenase complex, E2 component, dihydrolipoyllysine-residue acetyltransferase family protein [Parvimonas sp. KA00067]|uniref:dihydrolipoamide acetyltransferase n=1 Tax=Parvimonas sp. KA00067 TaxID=1588755 RepID=UPI00079C569D|nr:dihydrolipoamide acetyltransferase [Parvimonas sp. KA00067]KXB65822.1 TPP-dependent acetoin dehydrogenase complex, E2 component, dihydrolipoyllysine-residue acetyltransferase family protein [Parvimonas sp. KA00067]
MSDIKFRATPVARFLSKQNNIDLSLLKGTGPKGRIQKEDVLNFKNFGIIRVSALAKKIAEVENIDLSKVVGTGVNGKILKDDVLDFLRNENVVAQEAKIEVLQPEVTEVQKSYGEITEVPMSMMRRTVAKRMSESYFTAPVFVANIEVDMTEVKTLRANIMEQLKEETGYKLTITDIISLATVKSLMKHPYVNCSLSKDGTKILLHKYVNLAMAVGLENGLLTPVVKNAEKMSLRELMISLKDLTKKAVEMKLESEELEDSTFTISNLGMFGIDSFAPIINQPNSAILGVSATVDKPVVLNGEIAIRPIMKLSITVDHRVVDGMEAAKFLNTLKNYLENPISILV